MYTIRRVGKQAILASSTHFVQGGFAVGYGQPVDARSDKEMRNLRKLRHHERPRLDPPLRAILGDPEAARPSASQGRFDGSGPERGSMGRLGDERFRSDIKLSQPRSPDLLPDPTPKIHPMDVDVKPEPTSTPQMPNRQMPSGAAELGALHFPPFSAKTMTSESTNASTSAFPFPFMPKKEAKPSTPPHKAHRYNTGKERRGSTDKPIPQLDLNRVTNQLVLADAETREEVRILAAKAREVLKEIHETKEDIRRRVEGLVGSVHRMRVSTEFMNSLWDEKLDNLTQRIHWQEAKQGEQVAAGEVAYWAQNALYSKDVVPRELRQLATAVDTEISHLRREMQVIIEALKHKRTKEPVKLFTLLLPTGDWVSDAMLTKVDFDTMKRNHHFKALHFKDGSKAPTSWEEAPEHGSYRVELKV